MAPPNSGRKTWSYLVCGNGIAKTSPKNARPWPVTVNSSSASRSRIAASDRRVSRPRSRPSTSRRISWKGPASTTGLYVESGGVSGKVHRRAGEPSGACASSTTGSPELLTTRQVSGAVTVNACGALRSGWSKQAHTWRASSGSKEVQTYTSLSAGSTDRCTPWPSVVSGWTVSTTRVFSAARLVRAMRPCSGGGRSSPLSRAETTVAAQSTKVGVPGSRLVNEIVETHRTSVPVSRSVRSTAMS